MKARALPLLPCLAALALAALMRVAQEGYAEIVRFLLEAGADTDIQRDDGATALAHATDYEHTEVARLLLEAGGSKPAAGQKPLLAAFSAVSSSHAKRCPDARRDAKNPSAG